jgi:Flp pilus assembly protein TadG
MIGAPPCLASAHDECLLARLGRDPSGNTLALAAAALFPLLGLLGGGIDMGRGFLSQSRLQQACDAGVLAARKRLGTAAGVTGEIPDDAALAGERFFNLNFRDGAYGTEERTFAMALDDDFAISGRATVNVRTTLMAVFGFSDMPVTVECQAQLNMANTDIMMVLDVTGSMAEVNPGDTTNRMEVMKATVRTFHAQMLAAAPVTTRLRFGFVPYSTNVNVGHLLADEWVNTDWHYQSREMYQQLGDKGTTRYERNWLYKSGSIGAAQDVSNYPATYHPATPGRTYVDANEKLVTVAPTTERYSCDHANPAGTYTSTNELLSATQEPFAGPPSGVREIELIQRVENGIRYSTVLSGTTCYVRSQTYDAYTHTYERVTDPTQPTLNMWRYDRFDRDVSNWRTESNGCIEERATYQIDDFTNVDLSRALDLDIDLVPTSDPATRWSPMYPAIVHARSMRYNGTGSFTTERVEVQADGNGNFINPNVLGLAACPARARKLAETTPAQLESYLGTLQPTGATYHDIGMIWGGRLLSPTGLFAAENADASSTRPSTRHLIFLTDGETAPRDLSYSSYGLEPLDQRRWRPRPPGSPPTLTQTVENRFAFACEQVKKKNISVWVISFGTAANPIMQNCAGTDRYFVADDAEQLQATFATIAKRMGELRVSR